MPSVSKLTRSAYRRELKSLERFYAVVAYKKQKAAKAKRSNPNHKKP